MKTCRNIDSLLTQLQLHAALAMHRAIEHDSLVPLREHTPPTYVPTALGTTQRLGGRTSAPEAGRIDSLAHALTQHTTSQRPHLAAHLERGSTYLSTLPAAPRQRAPGHVDHYRVRLPALQLRVGGLTYTLDTQTVDVDARAGAAAAALRELWRAPSPVTRARGGYQRQVMDAHVWAGWQVMVGIILARVEITVTREDYCAVGTVDAIQAA